MSVEILRPSSLFVVSGLWYGSDPLGGSPAVTMLDEDAAAGDGVYVYCLGGGRLNVFLPGPTGTAPWNRLAVRLRARRDASASGGGVTVRLYAAAAYIDQALTLGLDWSLHEAVFDGSWSLADLASLHVQLYQTGGDGLINCDALEIKAYDAAEPSYAAHPRPPVAVPLYVTPPLRGWY